MKVEYSKVEKEFKELLSDNKKHNDRINELKLQLKTISSENERSERFKKELETNLELLNTTKCKLQNQLDEIHKRNHEMERRKLKLLESSK
jgi:chromosome segregation ATPase